METANISKEALDALMNLKEEFDLVMESIELSNNPEVMESLRKSKDQIKNRDFADWNELQNSSN
tara:strand:- start:4 stop:195 length:192 start_codon:yes stop_codon:yes gene_type:complete